jgi:CheY-like chemotaxis protein
MIDKMQPEPLHILLADDDIDDYLFFTKALKEIDINTKLTRVLDGEQLMKYLFDNAENLPDILFLDLSMPRKTGIECLAEIEINRLTIDLPVIVLTTSFTQGNHVERNLKDLLLKMGAEKFIRKSGDFKQYKDTIEIVLKEISKRKISTP